ncbi:bifunctional methylenetetrahydrofolate dehydrogenase/methenyltetrahydrofolate cyclohydrolase [Candidatus Bathyarchaeota archaeon]|nr:bifunctional methylenetetrahydrofolate dehydrogenase/methenyltetrahydrofolate cyclohydrolase [Candidatus Bathyarchaeota archaeon]
MTIILNGGEIASRVAEELRAWASSLRGSGITPTLAMILVGEDMASRRYVELKARRCRDVGVETQIHSLPGDVPTGEVVEFVRRLGEDPSIHGVMVQLPLPEGVDMLTVVEAIPPDKDVDGLSPTTLGRILIGGGAFIPAGVEAIMELLKRYEIKTEGRHWVIAGRSSILGKPLAALLLNKDCAVTICDREDPNLVDYMREADILVVDLRRKWFVKEEMVKESAVVVDMGNNYEAGRVYGDVDFEEVKGRASAITPVPGGVGPLLISMLIRNTLKAAERSRI